MILTPKAIQFQTIDMCNRQCSFCPNQFDIRKTGKLMDESLFFILLCQMKDIDFKGRISPYLMNEPLLDPRLLKWLRIIRGKFPSNMLFINSNGDSILSRSTREALSNSGIDGIQINCYDTEATFKKRMLVVESWAQEDKRILVHYSGSLRKMTKRNDRVNVRVKWMPEPTPAFWNRAGHVPPVIPSGQYSRLVKCSYPFEQMYINHLGQAILCCCDYGFEVVLGDIRETPLPKIWKGRLYERYRRCHEDGNINSLLLCGPCNRITIDR